jgi:hypothetical protein
VIDQNEMNGDNRLPVEFIPSGNGIVLRIVLPGNVLYTPSFVLPAVMISSVTVDYDPVDGLRILFHKRTGETRQELVPQRRLPPHTQPAAQLLGADADRARSVGEKPQESGSPGSAPSDDL